MSLSIDQLERRRRLTLRWSIIGLLVPVFGWPLAMIFGEGSDTSETIAGGVLIAGFMALVAVPVTIGMWRRFMARTMLDALVEGRLDIRHIDGEQSGRAEPPLRSAALDLGMLAPCGLVEPFDKAGVDHVLVGEVEGIPFTLAELRLYDDQGFEVFQGVVGGFGLHRTCPGLTIVTRERGLIGNFIASFGSGIDRVGLEDPVFERRFEVYGTDQVWCRTVLTPTMLERLVGLDEVARAGGFRCAFAGKRLLIALSGMRWRAPTWRLLVPIGNWLEGYRKWLSELVALPSAVVEELALADQVPRVGAVPPPPASTPWEFTSSGDSVFQGKLGRLVAGITMPLMYIASGTLFGGVSLYFGYYVFVEWGVDAIGGWKLAWPILLGVGYGIYAIVAGLVMLARLAWRWNAPLRSLPRPAQPSR
ncbi:MAG: DUF3137 domain-containing protein [Geminicoccaceae bacterium]